MKEILLETLFDSLKVFGLVLLFNIAISFVESKIAMLIEKKGRFAPILGSFFGAIPQCGVSVVAADLYQKKHITTGTLIAIFLSCSDEAMPILFSSKESALYGFLLVGIKILTGIIIGYLIDLLFHKSKLEVENHHMHCKGENEIHVGCCNHEIEVNSKKSLFEHIVHPLIHSLKIFIFVLIFNLAFSLIIFYVGKTYIYSFLETNVYLTPLMALLIGLIPNCASSVILAESFINGAIPFSALLCGLSVNAGLGMVILYKNTKDFRRNSIIFLVLILTSLVLGYGLLNI